MSITLFAASPFSLSAVVGSHGWSRLAPFTADRAIPSLVYIDRLSSGRVVRLSILEALGGVSVEPDADLGPAEVDEVGCHVRWMLGLDQQFSAFYALAREEPELSAVEARAQGRLLRCPSLFEDTVKTILTTNTVWSATIRMVERVVTAFGDPLPADPALHAFPTPQRMAALDGDTLRSVARLGYRAPYVLELARTIDSGALDLEALRASDLPTRELRKHLLAIKGVGAYAAANLLMILGRYDFLTIDSWALKMVSHEWYGGQPVGSAEVEAAFARWGEWKGLAYWFWDWSYRSQA